MTDKELVKQIIVSNQERFRSQQLVRRNEELPIASGKIITVSGVRRCGKSAHLMLTIGRLLAAGIDKRRILYINFDDERISFNTDNLNIIVVAYQELYAGISLRDAYLFFDEIQLAEGWQSFVRRIYEEQCPNIFITGSNSQMLSSEIASTLRGRSLQYEEYPLSFNEMCRFRGVDTNVYSDTSRAQLATLFDEYLSFGGFPEVVLADPHLKDRILSDYFYLMLYRDLVEHFNINPATTARYFIRRVMENITKPTSVNKIYKELKSQGLAVSKDTVYSLAEQYEAVYLFLPLYRYTGSVQRSTTSDTKFYCIDMGLRKQTLRPQNDDNGKMLENAVFLHLRRSLDASHTLTYYKGNKECDFVLSHHGEVEHLVQVSWDISDPQTLQREVEGIAEAAQATGCTVMTLVTYDEERDLETPAGIVHIQPAWKWMLATCLQ